MKLHLPVRLFKAVLTCMAAITALTMGSGTAWADAQNLSVSSDTLNAGNSLYIGAGDTLEIPTTGADLDSDLVLGAQGSLILNAPADLNHHSLQLDGSTCLILTSTGDGRVYDLFTEVGSLLDAEGNALSLTSSNNDIALYFDESLPGSGFWANSTLQLTADGTLQLVRYTDISLPSGYGSTVTVDDVSDITRYSSYAKDVIFRVDSSNLPNQCLTIDGLSSSLMSSSADSWFFTSTSVDSLASLCFSNATTRLFYVASSENLTFSQLNCLVFSDNTYSSGGGAIYGDTITLSNNGSVSFSGNTSSSSGGGAISGDTITLSNNGSVSFSGNTAENLGGAISGHTDSSITLSHNGSVSFSGNTASVGGAIYGFGDITLSNNGCVSFSGNTAENSGGAIEGDGDITLSNNGSVSFSGNTASSGGAIEGDGDITLSNNGSVSFSGNTAEFYGGAIYGDTITLSNNGSVSFSGNTVETYGGAIDGNGDITLSNNGSVIFRGNVSGSSIIGGAIYTRDATFSIQNNETVLFEGNYNLNNQTLRLRSIYVQNGSSLTDVMLVQFSAPEGGSIEFRDSLYIDVDTNADSAMHLNAQYETEDGQKIAQTGDIIISGAYATEENLTAILKEHGINRKATASEISNSKSSIIYGVAELHDGRFIIRDGAVLTAHGMMVHASASGESTPTLWLDGATLKGHSRSGVSRNALSIAAGSALELSSSNTIQYSDITLASGSMLTVNLSSCHSETPALTLNNSTLVLGNDITLTLTTDGSVRTDTSYRLLVGAGNPVNWSSRNITVVSGTTGWDVSFVDLSWVDNTLWLYYMARPDLSLGTWNNESADGLWNTDSANWQQGEFTYEYEDGVAVVFGDTAAGTVTLVGALAPGSVLVDSAEDYTWNPATAGGKLTGDMTLTKKGSGTLTINTQNDYTGGTVLEGGKLVLGTQTALGTGGVDLRAGTLDLNNLAVQNNICATGGTLAGGSRYQGELTVDGDLSLDGTTGAAGGIQILGGSISGSPIVDTDISANGEGAKEIISDITGSSSLTVNGGDLLVSGKNNDYTGGTVINGGSLTTGSSSALGSGDVALNDGELDLNKLPVKNDITATGGTLSGAENYEGKLTVNGDLTLGGETTASGIELNGGSISGGSIVDTDILVDGEGNMEISSDITGNSSLTLNGGDLLISGENNDYTGGTTINGGSLTLDTGSSFGTGDITLNGGTLDTNGNDITNDIINNGGTLITSYVLSEGRSLTVGKGGMKLMGYLTLAGGNLNFNGLPLTVEGTVEGQKAVNVFVSGYAVIDREGIVELANFGDDVSGVTAESFINTGYGTLSYDQTEHTLSITLTEKNVWMGGKGATWMMGTNAGWQDYRTFTTGNRVVFNTGGTVTITGGVEPASVLVDIEKSLTFSTKYDKKSGQFSGALIGKGCVVKRGKGTLTMNDGNTYSGGTFIEAGTVKAKGTASFGTGDITLLGGTLNLASKVIGNDIIVDGTAAVKGGKKYTGEFTLKSGELMKGSDVNVAEAATLAGGTVNGTLSGVGSVAVTGSVELGTTGKITTNGLDISGSLTASAKGLAMNSKSSVIDIDGGTLTSVGKISAWGLSMIGGTLDVMNEKPMAITLKDSFTAKEGAEVSLYGGLTANALELDGSTFTLAADFTEKAKAQTINIKGKGVQNSISGSTVDVAGKMTVIGDLKVEDSSLSLHDVAEAAKPKAQGLSVKGDLNLTGGSTLSMTGALSAKNLTLGSGSSLTLGGSKMSTIKVGGELDLSGAVTLNLGFTVKETDVAKGKAFTLFTFKEFAGNLDNLTLGYEGAYTLDFNAKGTGITLVIADAAAWNEYATSVQETAQTTQPAVTLKEEEESELPVATATRTVDPVLAGLADTLVQSTWGVAGASRAFADTISGRGAHSTLLEGGKGAAWVSVMGGSSRISSDGGHTGADFTLSGAAIGIEGNVTEKSTIGLAIGNSWGKVSPFSAYRVDQDSTHMGIYGNHALGTNTTMSWAATHTRTESDGTLAGMPAEWTQDALQLDARLTRHKQLSHKTTASAFVGLQYLATDSGKYAGIRTGSLQNLRAEIGVGATHRVSPATLVYGELSFVGDMVRNNPTADLGGYRAHGANPGRAGINLGVGATHQLTEDWSVNASYNFELMQNVTSHSLNLGASYSF